MIIPINGLHTVNQLPILATKGVREMLRRPDGRPAWARDAEIAWLMLGDEKRLELPKELGPVLQKGVAVRIEDGPFTGFPGNVLECDGIKTRVEVNIFGRMTPAWLDRISVVVV